MICKPVQSEKIVDCRFAMMETGKINEKMKPAYGVSLCSKLPIMYKLMQLIGIVLLYLEDLNGSEDIRGKKCA
jgi:hypothetical protein